MIILVMGVSGSGKSTVGREVARRLGWRFIEADDFHSPTSVAKMQRGEPLTDEDREPWLAALAAEVAAVEERGEDAVLACSALKHRYRQALLASANDYLVVYLRGSFDLVERRMEEREHFMPAALLESRQRQYRVHEGVVDHLREVRIGEHGGSLHVNVNAVS